MLRKDERYYYGWVIVLVMSVSNAVTMGMGSLNFGLYIKPMGDDLVIGRAAFGWASTARSAAAAATGPVIGRMLDVYGARYILAIATLLTAAVSYTHLTLPTSDLV